VLARLEQLPPDDMAISAVTLAELRYGADKSDRPSQNHAALDAFLAPLSVALFDSGAADAYGKVRAALERRGTPIGPLDTLIAAHALQLGLTLVTNNVSEFARVPSLSLEDWSDL
jgi:tRNA(fMet)-specific endonuclease VapC